jgi:FAD/FMN-containing dehydrogenase
MISMDVSALRQGFAGELVVDGDESFDALRSVFNGMIDRRPAVIARCTSVDDVRAAVSFAREQSLPLSVYGGGHAVTGHAVCEDGVCVDLRLMNRVTVDPDARVGRVQGGALWRDVDAATQEHGLAVTGGRMSDTGVGGLALGSGSGWLERKLGLTCDSLRSVEIVTADGTVQTASESQNPELFWGTRGGGGNFGVVTEFEFDLHPMGPQLLGGMLMYPAPMARDVLRNFREVMANAPDELCAGAALISAPPEEFVPEPVRGQPVLGVVACYAGPLEDAEEGLRPLREFGPPAMDMVQPVPYVVVQQLIDGSVSKGLRNYWTADFLAELPDEAIDIVCEGHLSRPSPITQILVIPGGGAISRVPDEAMAFGQRSAPFNLHILGLWDDEGDDAENIAWTRELGARIKPYTTGRAYLNFIGEEGEDRVRAAFGPETYARLQALKDRYDPQNLFRLNQNIKPTGWQQEKETVAATA